MWGNGGSGGGGGGSDGSGSPNLVGQEGAGNMITNTTHQAAHNWPAHQDPNKWPKTQGSAGGWGGNNSGICRGAGGGRWCWCFWRGYSTS